MLFSNCLLALSAALLLTACDGVTWWSGVRGDRQEAASLFMRARDSDMGAYRQLEERVQAKDHYAAFYLGRLEQHSSSTSVREDSARNYVSALPLNGARFNLAILWLDGIRIRGTDSAVDLLEAAAKDGHVPSMLLLATVFESGRPDVPKNTALAKQWYQKAIDVDKSAYAELRLGALLQAAGEAVAAEKLLISAAKYGFPEAQYRLAALSRDPRVAAQWKVAASLGDHVYAADARRALAVLTPEDAAMADYNARMWVHVFRNDRFVKPAIGQPSETP